MKRPRRPLRTAVVCVVRLSHRYYPAAAGKTYTHHYLEPMRVELECGHLVFPGEWRRKYFRKEWPCARCAELFPRVVIEAARRREAARHAAGRCGSGCPQCFAARLD